MRIGFIMAVVILTAATAHAALAQEPGPSAPTPTADQIVFVGRVPAPAGTTVTLRVFDIDTADFTSCATATTLAVSEASSTESSFVLTLETSCLGDAEGAVICWDQSLQQCDVVAAMPGAVPGPLPSLAELGQTIDTGLLAAPAALDPEDLVLPHGDSGPTVREGLPSVGSTESEERGHYYQWLLWAGLGLLGAGLILAATSLAAVRRR